MATQQAISTISYNTEAFLLERLEGWRDAHIIQAYQVIRHKGEDGDKDHFHVRIEPNKRIDPMNLSEALKEYIPGNAKPLGVRPWRQSKEEDWILYAVHEPDYMALKYPGDTGEKIPYDWKDIKVSDGYDMETAFIRARAAMKHSSASLVKRMQSGETPLNLILQGENAFTVNAINRALIGGEYAELSARYNRLEIDHLQLVESIHNFGFDIARDDKGFLVLVPGPDCKFVPF